MRRSLVPAFTMLLLAACSREHGDAPKGTYAPGGPIDDRGNAATSRALHQQRPTGSAEAPGAKLGPEELDTLNQYDRYDAGDLDASAGRMANVTGRLLAIDGQQIRIEPEQGAPLSLELQESPQITLGGTLVSQGDLREGAQVRASFRTEDGMRVADDIEVLRTPDEGRGLWQPGLAPPGGDE